MRGWGQGSRGLDAGGLMAEGPAGRQGAGNSLGELSLKQNPGRAHPSLVQRRFSFWSGRWAGGGHERGVSAWEGPPGNLGVTG